MFDDSLEGAGGGGGGVTSVCVCVYLSVSVCVWIVDLSARRLESQMQQRNAR